jgi:hypothetical protein
MSFGDYTAYKGIDVPIELAARQDELTGSKLQLVGHNEQTMSNFVFYRPGGLPGAIIGYGQRRVKHGADTSSK